MKNWKKHLIMTAAILAIATAAGFYGNTASAANWDPNEPPEMMEHHEGRDYHIALDNAGNPPAPAFHHDKHHPGEFQKRPPKPRKECKNPEEHKKLKHEWKQHKKEYHPEHGEKHHKEYRW